MGLTYAWWPDIARHRANVQKEHPSSFEERLASVFLLAERHCASVQSSCNQEVGSGARKTLMGFMGLERKEMHTQVQICPE